VINIAGSAYFITNKEKTSMPQHVSCQACGHVLYEGPELRPPDEILQDNEGKCPKCGKKLSFIPIDVNVKPIR
jgi:DNA-directed RNA polymerase subunit RPC12/RpoP